MKKMKVLIVQGGNRGGIFPFVKEQVDSLNRLGVETKYFLIKGTGILGYLKNLPLLNNEINIFKPDLIHAHYGLSGLFANLQRKTPVITTYHGSDINIKNIKPFSKICSIFSKKNIFVSKKIYDKMPVKKSVIIPCGVDTSIFFPIDKNEAKLKLNLDETKGYILFSSAFDNQVKNFNLALESINLLENKNVELIEFKNYTREESNLLFNAVDLALLTSFIEGSPQFIKEAMACNCPIVSTDVGDVSEVIIDTDLCFIANTKTEISNNISEIQKINKRTNGRDKINNLDINIIAQKIHETYLTILKTN